MPDAERRYLTDPLFHARVTVAARVLEDEEGFDSGAAAALAMAALDAADQAVPVVTDEMAERFALAYFPCAYGKPLPHVLIDIRLALEAALMPPVGREQLVPAPARADTRASRGSSGRRVAEPDPSHGRPNAAKGAHQRWHVNGIVKPGCPYCDDADEDEAE